eukprot:1050039-Pyramimonas_sp.AAC.1
MRTLEASVDSCTCAHPFVAPDQEPPPKSLETAPRRPKRALRIRPQSCAFTLWNMSTHTLTHTCAALPSNLATQALCRGSG